MNIELIGTNGTIAFCSSLRRRRRLSIPHAPFSVPSSCQVQKINRPKRDERTRENARERAREKEENRRVNALTIGSHIGKIVIRTQGAEANLNVV